MFGIIDDNKKFILLDIDHDRMRTTALMLAKKEIYTEEMCIGDECIEVERERFVPMFNEENIDEVIAEYAETDIETAYNGEKYMKGFAPTIDNEYQSQQRERAYAKEVDPITAHISRLRDEEQTPEVQEKIAKLIEERRIKVLEIRQRYPYSE